MNDKSLLLPYPVSENRYWRVWDGRVVLSEEGREYKRRVKEIARWSGIHADDKPCMMEITLIPKAKKDGSASAVILDLDNAQKVTLDALQDVFYHNDRQVKKLVACYAGHAMKDGGVRVRWSEIG